MRLLLLLVAVGGKQRFYTFPPPSGGGVLRIGVTYLDNVRVRWYHGPWPLRRIRGFKTLSEDATS